MFSKKQIHQKQKKTEYIYCCSGCHQTCSDQHTFQQQHKTFTRKNIQSQINHFMHSEDQKWGQFMINLYPKIESIKEFVKKIQNSLSDLIIQQTITHIFNLSFLSSVDKTNLAQIFKQIKQSKYNKLNCDQIFQINSILQRKKFVRPNINEAFLKIQRNLGKSIIQFIEKEFKVQKDEKIKKQQYSKNVMLEDRYQKQIDKKYNQQKFNRKQKIISKQISKQNGQKQKFIKRALKCSNTNEFPTIRVNEIQQFKGNFNIALKVLTIEKVFKVGKRQLIEFIAGDQTGRATCVFNNSQIIKQGKILSVSKCRVYIFHKTKQIQNTANSEIFEQDFQIKNIGEDYNLSRRNRTEKYNRNIQQKHSGQRNRKPRNQYNKINQIRRQRQGFNRLKKIQQIKSHTNQRRGNEIYHDDQNDLHPKKNILFQQQNNRKKVYTNISEIGPGDQKVNIFAQLIQVIHDQLQIQLDKQNFICLLGDSTAVIKAKISSRYNLLKKGKVFQFYNINAIMIYDKIILVLDQENGGINETTVKFPNINLKQNISNIQWEEISDSDQKESKNSQDNDSTFLQRKDHNQHDDDYIEF